MGYSSISGHGEVNEPGGQVRGTDTEIVFGVPKTNKYTNKTTTDHKNNNNNNNNNKNHSDTLCNTQYYLGNYTLVDISLNANLIILVNNKLGISYQIAIANYNHYKAATHSCRIGPRE